MNKIEKEKNYKNNFYKTVIKDYYPKTNLNGRFLNCHLIFNFFFWLPIINFLCLNFIFDFPFINSEKCNNEISKCIISYISLVFGCLISLLIWVAYMIYSCINGFDLFKNNVSNHKTIKNIQSINNTKKIELLYSSNSSDTQYINVPYGYLIYKRLLNYHYDKLILKSEDFTNEFFPLENKELSYFRTYVIDLELEIYYKNKETYTFVKNYINYCKKRCDGNTNIQFEIPYYNSKIICVGSYLLIWNKFWYFIATILQLTWIYRLLYFITSKHLTWHIIKCIDIPKDIKKTYGTMNV